jgi:hypothetical protein
VVRALAVAVVVALVAVVVGASCTLFQDEIPDRSCRQDSDCFRAQGERCDPASMTCVMAPDAAPPADAMPMVDAP